MHLIASENFESSQSQETGDREVMRSSPEDVERAITLGAIGW
ncbi:hypothetical protein [Nostoc sp. C110]